jgi:hypothetical protein
VQDNRPPGGRAAAAPDRAFWATWTEACGLEEARAQHRAGAPAQLGWNRCT